MPLAVITVKNAPPHLRGDLSKWMQEIATGVYVGNFNTKIREQLWNRVVDNIGHGEATMSFSYRNEIGYQFNTINAQREVIDFDGIPLVSFPNKENSTKDAYKPGFSNASKFRKVKKYSSIPTKKNEKPYVVIDIETDGLNEVENSIIEIGAVKLHGSKISEFNSLVEYKKNLPKNITDLTGITQELLEKEGKSLDIVLVDFLNFIEDLDIVGYGVNFDIKFIDYNLKNLGMSTLKNNRHDLIKYVKREKIFLENYKLQTVLRVYDINEKVPHRALLDSKLIYKLSTKVNTFLKKINKK